MDVAKWALKSETNMRLLIFAELFAFFLFIFIPAGRLGYWQGWLYLLVQVPIFVWVANGIGKMKGVVKERLSPGKGMKGWDKVIFVLVIPITLAIFPVASADVGRFGWSPGLPWWLYIIAYVALVSSEVWGVIAMKVNPYFSSVVRIQKDRKQKVVQSGPYAIVRHPGYIGGMVFMASTALALGSVYALIPAAISIVLFVIRTYLEDEMLKAELSGYKEYAKKVKYRLIPGIW